jgi:WD40 repeat protein
VPKEQEIDTHAVAFSPDGSIVATAGSSMNPQKGIVRLWTVNSGKIRATIPVERCVWSLSFSPTSNLLAIGDMNGAVGIWDFKSRRLIKSFKRPGGGGASAFTSDGKSLLIAGGSKDSGGTVALLQMTSGELSQFTGNADRVDSVAFSPDQKEVAAGSSSFAKSPTLDIFDSTSGNLISSIDSSVLGNVGNVKAAYSPCGRWLAFGSRELLLLNRITKTVSHIPPPDKIKGNSHVDALTLQDVTYSGDGTRLIALYLVSPPFRNYFNHALAIWDAITLTLIKAFDASRYDRVAASPISNTFVTGSTWLGDGASLWDATDGSHLRHLEQQDVLPSFVTTAIKKAADMQSNISWRLGRAKAYVATDTFDNKGTTRREKQVARLLRRSLPVVAGVRFSGDHDSITCFVDLTNGQAVNGGLVTAKMSASDQAAHVLKYIRAQISLSR